MFMLLMTLFIILCLVLAAFILIQQGKGDMGLGSMSGGRALFGATGGQEFFERSTWIMCAIFILGSLGLAIMRSHQSSTSLLENYSVKQQAPTAPRGDAQADGMDKDLTTGNNAPVETTEATADEE